MKKNITEQTELNFTPDDSLSQLLTMDRICHQLQVSRKFIYDQINAGHFPKPLKLGRASRFKRKWVVDYLIQCDQNVWEKQV